MRSVNSYLHFRYLCNKFSYKVTRRKKELVKYFPALTIPLMLFWIDTSQVLTK